MRVVTALGLLALLALAVNAQTAAIVTNVPALGERVTYALDSNLPTTGAISILDSGTNWVVYGTNGSITWYNSSCVMQGLPSYATWSATGCYYTTASMYPVTSVVKTGADSFIAIANDTVTMFKGMTPTMTLNSPGSTFDLAMLSYPQYPAMQMPTVWNNFLYIGSYNVNKTGMSAVRKIDLAKAAVSWTAWAPNPFGNYPVSIAMLSNGATVAVSQSATSNGQDVMFAPFDDMTGMPGNSTLSIAAVESQQGCAALVAGTWICNQVQFSTATVNGMFYIAATTLNAELIVVDFTSGMYATAQSGLGGSNTLVMQAFGTWIFLGKGSALDLIDTTKISASVLSKTGGVIPSSSYNSGNGITLPTSFYTPYIQAVLYNNMTSTFWLVHTQGIATATVAMFLATSTSYATVWWWYWRPFVSSGGSNVPSMALQGAWIDPSTPMILYATWGSSYSNSLKGSAWAFNMTSQMAVWRFGDNYDARGPAIWVPSSNVAGGLWFGVANAATSPYGRRVLLAWAADTTGMWGQVLTGVASYSYSSYSTDVMHMMYSNVSGLLAVVSRVDSTFTLYNATTLMVNASTTISVGSPSPSRGILTIMTMHCVTTSTYLYCIDWTTGMAATSITISNSGLQGQPIVVGNRYIVVRDGSYNIGVLDMAMKTPVVTSFSGSSGNYVNANPAGWINPTDNSLVLAVPGSGGSLRVFYGADGTTFTDVVAPSATGTSYTSYTFTTNAIAFGGYLWAAGNYTAYSTTMSTRMGQITRIPLMSVAAGKTVTKAQASMWVMTGGTSAVGNIVNLFSSPLFPNMLFSLGDTFTAWDISTGNTYFSVPPLATLSFLTASNSAGNYDYFPSVDWTTRGVVVGMMNVSNNVFMGYAILSPLDGTLLRFVSSPATSASGTNWLPQSTPTYNGNMLVLATTHICEYATTTPWNVSWSPSQTDFIDARTCTTLDGLTASYGWAQLGNWSYYLVDGNIVKASRVQQSYQAMVPYTISGSPGGVGGNAPASDSKTGVIVGIIIAVVVVGIIAFVVVKKLGSGGGSGGGGVNYNEMGGKGV